MSEIDRIKDQLRRAYQGHAWHGPSVREALAGVTAAQAAARPLSDAHSIWEIVHHIGAWEDIVRQRLEGSTPKVTRDVNWPPVRIHSSAAWKRSLAQLDRIHQRLARTVAAYDSARLDEKPAGRSTAYRLMHGAIQHDLYHAGQIAILKKGARKK